MDELRDMLDGFPGIQAEVVTFLGDRISETITGESAPVVVNVYGDDLDLIDDKAREVARVLQSIPGGKNAQVKSPPGAPRMAVRLRTERLTQLGFRPVEVLEAIQTAYRGDGRGPGSRGQPGDGCQCHPRPGRPARTRANRLAPAQKRRRAGHAACGNWLTSI